MNQSDFGYRDFGYMVRPAAQLVGAYQLDAHTLEGGDHAHEAISRLLDELGYDPKDPVLTDLLLAATHISSKLLDGVVASEIHGDQVLARSNKQILREIIATFNETEPERSQPGDPLVIVAEYTPSRHGWRVDVSTINKGNTIVRASEGAGPPQAYQKAQVLIDQIRALLPDEQIQIRHQVEGQEAGFRRWAAAYGW